jgi:hypothetical protein
MDTGLGVRSRITTAFLGFSIFAGLSSSAPCQITPSGTGYLLRVNYTKGLVLHLTTRNQVAGLTGTGGPKMSFVLPITIRVLDVRSHRAKVQMKLGAVQSKGTVLHAPQTAIMWLDNRNQPGDGDDGRVDASGGVASQLPLRVVHVGDSWKASAPVSLGTGEASHFDAKYTFMGIKTIEGKQVAVISYVGSGLASGKGVLTLLVKDGTVNSNFTTLTMALGDGKPITIISNMKRD